MTHDFKLFCGPDVAQQITGSPLYATVYFTHHSANHYAIDEIAFNGADISRVTNAALLTTQAIEAVENWVSNYHAGKDDIFKALGALAPYGLNRKEAI